MTVRFWKLRSKCACIDIYFRFIDLLARKQSRSTENCVKSKTKTRDGTRDFGRVGLGFGDTDITCTSTYVLVNLAYVVKMLHGDSLLVLFCFGCYSYVTTCGARDCSHTSDRGDCFMYFGIPKNKSEVEMWKKALE